MREFLQKREASAKAGAKKTTPQSPPQAGLPAAVPQSTPQAGPSPSAKKTDTAKAEAEKGLGTTTSAKSSTKVTGGLGNVDLGYKAKSAEEIEAQIAGMSQREMAKNKGYLDAEAADVKAEADELLKAKGGDQKRLLFSMAAAAFGSKAQGLDLGGIMAAGLKTDADQRKLNTEAEKALRDSKKQMRKFEQAMRAGADEKAGRLYGLAQADAKVAQDAKEKQIDLALKQQGLDIQRQSLTVQRAQAGRNQQIELVNAAMKDPKFAAMFKELNPSAAENAPSTLMAKVRNDVMAEVSRSKEWLSAKTQAERDAIFNKELIAATRYIPLLSNISSGIGFSGANQPNIREGSL